MSDETIVSQPPTGGIAQIAAALAKAQAVMVPPKKTSVGKITMRSGGSYEFHFAPLDAVIAAVREPFAANGLSFIQVVHHIDVRSIGIETILLHASGEQLSGGIVVLPAGETAQQLGSSCSYGRRYSLATTCGLAAEEDTDAADVGPRTVGPAAKPAPSAPRPAATAKPVPTGDMSPLMITDVIERSGTSKAGKPYTAWQVAFSDGRKASTFDRKIAEAAQGFLAEAAHCYPVMTAKGEYLNLIELSAHDDAAPATSNGFDKDLGF